MKKFLFIAAAAAALAAAAAIQSVSLFDGSSAVSPTPSKIVAVKAVSTVADGTASVKSESVLYRYREVVTTNSFTNLTFTVVFSNGTQVVTNTVAREAEILPLPAARLSYVTNRIVTATVLTNAERYAAMTVTNVHANVTCSSGVGSESPSDAFVGGNDRIWFDGSAKGRVMLFLEK